MTLIIHVTNQATDLELTNDLTRSISVGVVLREIEIRVDLASVQIVEVHALGRHVYVARRHEAEHAAEHAAAAGPLLVRAERLGGARRARGRRRRAGRRRLGQLPPAPRLRRLVALPPCQLHLRVRLHGGPAARPSDMHKKYHQPKFTLIIFKVPILEW